MGIGPTFRRSRSRSRLCRSVLSLSTIRMESIFRLLLHEQSLVHEHLMDKQLLSSIECHKRDLYTALETAKWQLEDFVREVNSSAITDKLQLKKNVIGRHMQFIGAIREQIIHVEQSMDASLGNSSRNMYLNEHDKDGLALFLTGKNPVDLMGGQDSVDESMLRRFLDPAMSSSPRKNIDENKAGEIVNLNVNEISFRDHNNLELKNSQVEMDLGPSVSFEGASTGMYDKDVTWDLEANHAFGRSNLHRNNLRRYFGRMNIFRSLGNFRFSRSFTKKLKDGEEHRQPQPFNYFHPDTQRVARLRSTFGYSNLSCFLSPAQAMRLSSWIRGYREKCHQSLHDIQARYHPLPSILALLLILLFLSLLMS